MLGESLPSIFTMPSRSQRTSNLLLVERIFYPVNGIEIEIAYLYFYAYLYPMMLVI